jgi:hypothetical protein
LLSRLRRDRHRIARTIWYQGKDSARNVGRRSSCGRRENSSDQASQESGRSRNPCSMVHIYHKYYTFWSFLYANEGAFFVSNPSLGRAEISRGRLSCCVSAIREQRAPSAPSAKLAQAAIPKMLASSASRPPLMPRIALRGKEGVKLQGIRVQGRNLALEIGLLRLSDSGAKSAVGAFTKRTGMA